MVSQRRMPVVWIVPSFDVFEKGSFSVVDSAEAVGVRVIGCASLLCPIQKSQLACAGF